MTAEIKEEKEIRTPEKIKKSLRKNTIKLIIGVILLVMCGCYLHKNHAEAISITSSYTTIAKNVEVFFQNLFGHNGERLKKKYDLEDYFETMITTAEDKGCIDSETLNELRVTYENLLVEPKNNLSHTLESYLSKAILFNEEVKKDCTKEEILDTVQDEN